MSKVALAVLLCTGIKSTAKNPPTYLDSAPIAELALSGSKYEITGQILSLKPYLDNSDHLYWAWTLDFAAFHSGKSKRANLLNPVARMRHLTVTVSGQLVVSLPRDGLTSTSRNSLPDSIAAALAGDIDSTWIFGEPQLADAESKLKARVKDDEVRLKIPVFGYVKSGDFPYEYHAPRTCPGAVSVSHGSVPVKPPPPKDPRKPCRTCNKNILASEQQNHMGGHILLSLQATADSATEEWLELIILADFAASLCPRALVPSALSVCISSSTAKPYTNIPLRCILCEEFHWKYNMERHLLDRHPRWELTVSKDSREQFKRKYGISDAEKQSLGVTIGAEAAVESLRGEKRHPVSPAGTPRRQRHYKTRPPPSNSRNISSTVSVDVFK
ncbi:hypothetical protein DFH08DRAFT_941247 [Mycena albidolilacea]|uniref:C2H2-type domain-containing protein n=1 Tax=Mycena albidolilacea TaxID=1033008 RepID=A0AAD7EIU0_9AGAR|nr:hypothetical protein DFH08DRAFT_941247 [Mycena albidolilacea]